MAEHRLLMAKVSLPVAKRMGLNTNHHARLWCSCMDDPSRPPGYYSGRPVQQVLNDPRRLGAFDHFAVVDLRVPGSAAEAFRKHVEESDRER